MSGAAGAPGAPGTEPRRARPGPGAITVARVDATSGWRRFAPGAGGSGWFRLSARLADPAGLDAWVDAEVTGPAAGHRDVAGALLTYRVAGSLAELVVGPLLDQRRSLALHPGVVALLLGPDRARLDGVAVEDVEVAVLASDPDAARAGTVVVADDAGLRAVAVEAMLATYGPLVDAVRARAPFGRRGMWGTLADHLAEVALRRAREQKRDAAAAWAAVEALLDDLAAREPLLVVRPRRQDVVTPAGGGLFAAKGTCCLIYKPAGSVAAAACTSCPLRSPADRAAGFARYLAQVGTAG